MGQIRFLIPRPERLPPQAAERAYMAGMDGVPWEGVNSISERVLTIDRFARESGNLYCAWIVEGHGELVLCTGSLLERDRPFHLSVELARGTINRLRNQVAQWQMSGLIVTPVFTDLLRRASQHFGRAAINQANEVAAEDEANQSMRLALDAINLLSLEYARQVIDIRRTQQPQLTTLLAARLEEVPEGAGDVVYRAAFNTVLVSPVWKDVAGRAGNYDWTILDKQVQWCRDHGLRICFGPLLQFDRHQLPDWLYLWEDDFDEVQASALEYARQVIQRYRGKVHLWYGAGRLNSASGITITDEERLRLAVSVLDVCHELDSRTPTIVGFDRPWAEYIAEEDRELTPLHFADTLVRSDLGMAGIGLELNLGYWPNGTLPRDLLEISRMVDRWTSLGLPLVIQLTLPSAMTPDPKAQMNGLPLSNLAVGGPTAAWQQQSVERLVKLLIAKQSVQAIIWSQWRDDRPHDFAHGGLFDSRGVAKPVLASLTRLRKEFLE